MGEDLGAEKIGLRGGDNDIKMNLTVEKDDFHGGNGVVLAGNPVPERLFGKLGKIAVKRGH